MKRLFYILTTILPMAIVLLSSCNSDVIGGDSPTGTAAETPIHIGMLADEPEVVIAQTRADDEVVRKKAETVPWLKGALLNGLDITYSNLTTNANGESTHNKTNERVAILKWTGTRNETKDIGIYTFKYKGTEDDALWYDNGKHYFEGQYVPEEIREKDSSGENTGKTVRAQNLTTNQKDDNDYTYGENGQPSGTIGNYTLLSHYIGMPPNWTTSATIDQILLPFKHRLARVIAYVLIDDELKTTLEGYTQKVVDAEGNTTAKDDPATTEFTFGNVQVLEKVKETDIAIQNATTANLTPKWTTARKVVPHFCDEFKSSKNAKEELAATDDDAANNFIVYTHVRDNKKYYPRDGQKWLTAHQLYREKAGATGNDPVADNKITNAETSGYTRQMYKRVPIYDIIVRPTYAADNMVMYDEEGYYYADKTPNKTVITGLANQKNSIEFEMTLGTGLIYKKKFEFDLNANQQTVVYLTVDREGINYDDSASELWISNNKTDGYYGIDNQLGHNLSKAGSSWQRAVRYGTAPVDNVTDGNFYQDETEGDVSGQYFNTPSKWVEEFAKAYWGGARHGDYFILDKDITIDVTKLPDNFVFTGHLDGRGHTITLINTDGKKVYKPAESIENLYVETTSGYSTYTIPTLYTRTWVEEQKYSQEEANTYNEEHGLQEDNDEYKRAGDVKTPAHWEYTQKTITSLNDIKAQGLFTDKNGTEFKCPTLYQFSHQTDAALFKGLNATYETEQERNPSITPWEANVHKEYYTNSQYYWVPVKGYRAEILNVKLSGGTFFPKSAVFTGTDLQKTDATVSGYIFNCWELKAGADEKDKKVENIVPIPQY